MFFLACLIGLALTAAAASAAPTLTVTSPTEGQVIGTSAPPLTGTITLDSGATGWSFVDGYYPLCTLDSAPPSYCGQGQLWGLDEGNHVLTVTLYSTLTGTVEGQSKTINFSVEDVTAPSLLHSVLAVGGVISNSEDTILIMASPDSATISAPGLTCGAATQSSLYLAGSLPQPVSAFDCSLVDQTDGPRNSTYTLTDRAGNVATGPLSWTVNDPDSPTLQVIAPAASGFNASSTLVPEGTFDPGKGASAVSWQNMYNHEARCGVDGATPTAAQCEFVDNLSNGNHTFAVSIWDQQTQTQVEGVGQASNFTLHDTAGPSLLAVSPAIGGTISDITANVVLQMSPDIETLEVTGLTCPATGERSRLVSPEWPPGMARTSFVCKLSGAVNGAHAATYSTTDWAGNASSGSLNWTVSDSSAPQIAITQPATGATVSSNQVQFSYEMYGDATVTCQLDDAPFDCNEFVDMYGYLRGNFQYEVADGAHTFSVTATDAAGNTDTRASAFTVLATDPSASKPFLLTAPEAGQSIGTSALAVTGRIHDRTGSGQTKNPFCRIDEGDWQPCETAIALEPGARVLNAKLVVGSDPDTPSVADSEKSVAFMATADTTAPLITGVTNGMTINDAAQTIPVGTSFDTQSVTAAGFNCTRSAYSVAEEWEFSTVTAGNFDCTSAHVRQGTESVTITATDFAGNTSTLVRSLSFVPPTPTASNPFVISTPFAGQSVATSGLAVSGQIFQRSSPVYKYPFCRIDDGDWQQCETVIPLAPGNHVLHAKLSEDWNGTGPSVPNSEQSIAFSAAVDVDAPTINVADNLTFADSGQSFYFSGSLDAKTVTAEGYVCTRSGYTSNYVGQYSTATGTSFSCRAEQVSNGTRTVVFTATDHAGNSGTTTRTFTFNDLDPPVITNLSPADGSSKESRYTNFSFSVSGSIATTCALDGAPQECSWGGMYGRTLSYGSHTWVIEARDAVGNAATKTAVFQIADVTPPVVAISSPADGLTFNSPFTIMYSASDTAGEALAYECHMDSQPWAACNSSSLAVDTSTEGAHQFFLRVKDLAGNETSRSINFNVSDTTPPAIAIADALNGATFTSSNVPESSYTIDDPNARITCRLDGALDDCQAWYGELYFDRAFANGSHTVLLTATDWVGNVSTASATFTVADVTAPQISLISPSPGAVLENGTDVRIDFEIDADENYDLTCSLDGAAYVEDFAWSSSCRYPALQNGTHTVSARAVDTAGNAATSSVTFTVADSVGPTITITYPSEPPYRFAVTPEFYFDVVGAAEWASCWFDDTSPSVCGGYYSGWSSLSQGDHEFSITAVDAAGNRTTLAVPFAYVDDVPPDISISSPADGAVFTSSPISAPTFAGSDIWSASRSCTVDGLPLGSNCNANVVWQSLSNGPHTLKLWATDSYGNTTFKQSTFTINDTTNETATIQYPAAGQTITDSSAYFSFTVSSAEYAGWYCRLDSRAWSSCAGTFYPTRLKNGAHTFSVKKIDNGERVALSTVNFTVADTTPPMFTLSNLTQDEVLYVGEWRNVYGTPWGTGSSDQCYLDGAKLSYCGFEANAIGQHTFRMERRDPAGNVGEASVDFSVVGEGGEEPGEDGPLNLAVSDPLAGATVPVSPMVRYSTNRPEVRLLYGWIDNDDEDKARLRVNGTGWRPAAMTEGAHTIHLQAVGHHGSVEEVAVPVVVEDADPTLVEITAPKAGATVTQSPARIRFTAGSDITNSECRLDGGSWFTCSPYYAIVRQDLANGSHTVDVRVTDFGGHLATDSRTFTISDTTAPEFSITAPTEGQTLTGDARVRLSIANGEGYATVRCRINGAPLGGSEDGLCEDGDWLTGLVPGANELEVSLTDGVGNVATRAVSFTAAAPTAPLVRILRPLEGTVFTDSSYAVGHWVARRMNGDRPVTDYDESVQCNVDGTGWTNVCPGQRFLDAPGLPSSNYRLLAATNGSHSLGIRMVDYLGNSTASTVNYSVNDLTAPDMEVDEPASGVTYAEGDVPLVLDAEGIVDFECSLDDEVAYAPCVSNTLVGTWSGANPLDGGDHVLRVRAKDPAGNVTSVTRSFSVGEAVVDTEFTSGPDGFTNDFTPTFEFTVAPAGTPTQCRVDSAAWSSATSPYTATALTDGAHTIECRGVVSGVPESSPARRTITVDTIPPQTTIPTGPTTATKNLQPVFSLASDEPDPTFSCTIDDGAQFAATATLQVAPQAEGAHTLSCAAVDRAGNVDGSPATRDFAIDLTPPDTNFTSGLNEFVNDPTPTFGIDSSEEDAQFECRVDGGSWIAIGVASFTAPTLADGAHTVDCRSYDFAGNADASPATHEFTVDTDPPSTTATGLPPALSNQAAISVNLSSDEPTIDYLCDGIFGAVSVTGGVLLATSLVDWEHHANCKAVDRAGNADPTGFDFDFTIDRTAPTATFAVPTSEQRFQTLPAAFTYSIVDAHPAASDQCSVDDAAPVSCAGSFTPSALADGNHVFRVTSTDRAGNVGNSFVAFVVDTTPPETAVGGTPPAVLRDQPYVFSFNANEGILRGHCSLNDEAPITIQPVYGGPLVVSATFQYTFTPTTEGHFTLSCWAVDRTGIADPTPVELEFDVDRTGPAVSISSPSAGAVINQSNVSVEFSVTGAAGGGMTCQIDGQAVPACASPVSLTGLSEGTHNFTITAFDEAGNTTTVSREFVVDTVAPGTEFTSTPDLLSEDASPTVTLNSDDPEAKFECRLDAGDWQPIAAKSFTTNVVNGVHTIDCRAVDAAMTPDATPASVTFEVNASAPTVAIVGLHGTVQRDPTPEVHFTATDALPITVSCSIDGSVSPVCTAPFDLPFLSDGEHIFTVTATDQAGNVGTATAVFTVSVPAVVANAGDDIIVQTGDVARIDGSLSQPNDLIDRYQWELPDGELVNGPVVERSWGTVQTLQAKLTVWVGTSSSSDYVRIQVVEPPPAEAHGLLVNVRRDGVAEAGVDVYTILPDGSKISAVTTASGAARLRNLPDGNYTGYAYRKEQPATESTPKVPGVAPKSFEFSVTNGNAETVDLAVQLGAPVSVTVEAERVPTPEVANALVEAHPELGSNEHVLTGGVGVKFIDESLTFEISTYRSTSTGASGIWFSGPVPPRCQMHNFKLTCGGRSVYIDVKDKTTTVITVPVKASFSKEFFEVSMTVAATVGPPFSISPGTMSLDLPSGLSLLPSANAQSTTLDVPALGPQQSFTGAWLIRGDTEGEYNLSAAYDSFLQPGDEPIHVVGSTVDPIKVWGASALRFVAEAEDSAVKNHPYRLRVGLENVADIPVQNAQLGVGIDGVTGALVQPRQRNEFTKAQIEPGETFWTDDIVLIPRVTGPLDPASSYVATATGVRPATRMPVVTVAPEPDLNFGVWVRNGKSIFLWDAVAGASDYSVYATPDIFTKFGKDPFEINGVLPGATTQTRFVADVNDVPEQFYAVSPKVDGWGDMRHPMVEPEPATPEMQLKVEIGDGICTPANDLASINVKFSDPLIPLTSYEVRINGGAPQTGTISGSSVAKDFTFTSAGPGVNEISVKVVNAEGETFTATDDCPPGQTSDSSGGSGPEATCADSKLKVGPATLTASCFTKTAADVWKASGQVRVAGLDVSAGSVEINTKLLTFKATGSAKVQIGNILLYQGDVSWKLTKTLQFTAIAGGTIKGLPIAGGLKATLTDDIVSLEVAVALPNQLGGVTGSAKLTANIANGLDFNSLHVEVKGANLGGKFTFGKFALDWTDEGGKNTWTASVEFGLPGVPNQVIVGGRVVIVDGQFSYARIEVANLNKPIATAVFLQRVGLGVGVNPFRIDGSLGITLGPGFKFLGRNVAAVSLDGYASISVSSNVQSYLVTGSAKLVDVDIASAEVSYSTMDGAAFKGSMGMEKDLPVGKIKAKASIDGKFKNADAFYAKGKADLEIPGWSYGGEAIVSNLGVGACRRGIGPDVGFAYRWAKNDADIMATSCGIDSLKPQAFSSAGGRIAAAEQTFSVPSGQKTFVVKLSGIGGVPRVSFVSPRGAVIPGPSGDTAVDTATALIIPNTRNNSLYAAFERPAAGKWTVRPEATSPGLTALSTARSLPAVKVSGKLARSRNGASLSWKLKPIKGQRVVFTASGAGIQKVLVETNRSSGRVKLGIPRVSGVVRVEAAVEQSGYTRAIVKVAKIKLKALPLRRTKIRTTARKTTATIKWSKVRGAKYFEVETWKPGGIHEIQKLAAKRRSTKLTGLAPRQKYRVRVRAINRHGRYGPWSKVQRKMPARKR